MSTYTPIIGLEIHVELATKSKMFCGCNARHFGVTPNTHTCPVCLGLPGALPVPNKTAIDWTMMIGLALDCSINLESKFDRKHYFYPDLPKGYQISQYDQPLCQSGQIKLSDGSIRINRVHLEEDTGKLIHATVDNKKVTLVDFNRSGVPLVEIVTEPDMTSAHQAKEYVKKIHQLIRYLGVSDCDMEKGSMRLEANISLQKDSQNHSLPPYKVEVKNLNSFRFLHAAIEYEIERQQKILDNGKLPLQETRGWNETLRQTVSQRTKEEAKDYRYFPEPDIPPLQFTPAEIAKIRKLLPELPDSLMERLTQDYGLSPEQAKDLTGNKANAEYFMMAAEIGTKHGISAKHLANIIINKKIDTSKYLPAKLIQILVSQEPKVGDQDTLQNWVKQVISENPKSKADYQKGKTQAVEFLIGQVQRLARGQADTGVLRQLLETELKK